MRVQRAAAAWGPSRRRGSLYLWLAESRRHVVGVRLGVGPGAPSSSSSRRGARCRAAQRREEEEASRLPWGTWATGLPVAAVSGVVLFR